MSSSRNGYFAGNFGSLSTSAKGSDFARAPNFAFAFPPVTPSANALDPNVLKIAVAPDATNALRLDVLHSFGSAPPIEAERIVILPLRSFVAAPEVERDARSPLARAHAPYVIIAFDRFERYRERSQCGPSRARSEVTSVEAVDVVVTFELKSRPVFPFASAVSDDRTICSKEIKSRLAPCSKTSLLARIDDEGDKGDNGGRRRMLGLNYSSSDDEEEREDPGRESEAQERDNRAVSGARSPVQERTERTLPSATNIFSRTESGPTTCIGTMQPLAGTKRAASKPIFNPRQTQQKVFQATKKVNTLLPPQLRGRANEPTQDLEALGIRRKPTQRKRAS